MINSSQRYLAIALSTRGIGYAVLEGQSRLIDYGKKRMLGDKNAASLAAVIKLIQRYQPDGLVLPDVDKAKGTVRVPRIKRLHRQLVVLAKKQGIPVRTLGGQELRRRLLGNANGTKHELAVMLAQRYPAELGALLPPKRKLWMREDARMDVFDAVGLAAAVNPIKPLTF